MLLRLVFCQAFEAFIVLLPSILSIKNKCLLLLGWWHSIQIMRRRRKGISVLVIFFKREIKVFQEINDQSCLQCWTVVPVLCYLDVYLPHEVPWVTLLSYRSSTMTQNLIFCPVIIWYSTGTVSSLPYSLNLFLFLGLYLGTMLSSCHPPIGYSKFGVLGLYLNTCWEIFFYCSGPGKLCGKTNLFLCRVRNKKMGPWLRK